MARREDESILFVMSNAELLRIGRAMPLSEESLLACSPLSSFVRTHAKSLLEALSEALGATSVKVLAPSVSLSNAPVEGTERTSRSSTDPVYTPGRPGRGMWSVQEAAQARHGQVRRLEGCVSVSQILPTAAVTPIKSYKDRSASTAASPGSALYLASSTSVMGEAEEGDDLPLPSGGNEWDQVGLDYQAAYT